MKNGNYDVCTFEIPMQRLQSRGSIPVDVCRKYDIKDGDELYGIIHEVGSIIGSGLILIKPSSGCEFSVKGLKDKKVVVTLFIPSGYEKTIGK